MNSDSLTTALRKKTKAELVAWIIERAERSDETERALREWIAPEVPAAELDSALRKQITATWARVKRSREPFRMAGTVASELEPVLAGIESLLERGEADRARKLLDRFITACEPAAGQIDDSYGRLWPVLHHAVTLWGRTYAALAPNDPRALAVMVRDGILDNDYSIRDRMIRDFSEALGEEGLRALERLLREEHEGESANSELDSMRRTKLTWHLADVADALSDPDLYLEARILGGTPDTYALPIGRRFLDAGRHEEGLDWLERVPPGITTFRGEEENASTLRSRALKALGRVDEAKEALWKEFERTLNNTQLEQLAELLPESEHAALESRALDWAEQHHAGLTGTSFLLSKGEPGRAAALVIAQPTRFPGSAYYELTRLAEALSAEHPEASWLLYRNLVDDILDEGRTRAYSHGSDYITKMRELAASAGTEDGHENWETDLRAQHGRKRSFWKRLDE